MAVVASAKTIIATAALIAAHSASFAAEFTPKKPVVYLNLFNNQWNTNFSYWYPKVILT